MDKIILNACNILDQLGREDLADEIFYRFASKYNAPRGKMKSRWSTKYKKSINCSRPKGFSQKAHCAGRKKKRGKKMYKEKIKVLEVPYFIVSGKILERPTAVPTANFETFKLLL